MRKVLIPLVNFQSGSTFPWLGRWKCQCLCQSSHAKDAISLIISPNFNPNKEFTAHPERWWTEAYHQANWLWFRTFPLSPESKTQINDIDQEVRIREYSFLICVANNFKICVYFSFLIFFWICRLKHIGKMSFIVIMKAQSSTFYEMIPFWSNVISSENRCKG